MKHANIVLNFCQFLTKFCEILLGGLLCALLQYRVKQKFNKKMCNGYRSNECSIDVHDGDFNPKIPLGIVCKIYFTKICSQNLSQNRGNSDNRLQQ